MAKDINLIGVDEVGRGPIAGPVCVGVFSCNEKNILKIIKNAPHELKDSKKLTKLKREAWSNYLKECRKNGLCDFAINMQSSSVIDSRGIANAIKTAIHKSFKKLGAPINSKVMCDAGLRPPEEYTNYVSIIKGDEREAVIAMASIIAKVERDNFMSKMAIKHPGYGFESHVGYGTSAHYKALKNMGILGLHRKSFLKNILD